MSSPLVFLGLDLSTRRQSLQGKTMLARGEASGQGVRIVSIAPLLGDDALLNVLSEQSFVRCGIDCPLSLPSCVLCRVCPCDCRAAEWAVMLGFQPDDVFHYRLGDMLVRRTLQHVGPKPPLSNGGPVDITPLTLRWLRLSRTLLSRAAPLERIVEVYASGTIQILAELLGLVQQTVFRYRTSPALRASLLCELAERQWLTASEAAWEQLVDSDDAMDAAIACLSARLAYERHILWPSTLLGLDERASCSVVRPLQGSSKESRVSLAEVLLQQPWVALPDPLKLKTFL
ncbi:MAG: DUF429 domain-containing protein [Deltaproteobacteria bacterium]|nr:MAG: DUF429 domain-containing protein [Deltaproteobacteria bacterium]